MALLASPRKESASFFKAIKNPKPILSIIDLQPIERAQAIVWFDEFGSELLHRATVIPFALHVPVIGQWPKKSACHRALHFEQFFPAIYLLRNRRRCCL